MLTKKWREYKLPKVTILSKISIIIPAYDEGENLPKLIKALDRTFRGEDFEIIVVNDENTDGSVEIIRKLESEYIGVKGLLSDKRRGKAKAIRDGLKESKGEVIVLMDADLQYSPEDIPRLTKALKHVDVVNGLRVNRKDSIRRKFESKVYNLLVRTFFSVEFNDCNSGLKVFKRKVMDDIVDQLRDGWHRYLLVLAVKKGYKVKEIPISHHSRTVGRSKFASPLKLFKGFLDLLSVKTLIFKEDGDGGLKAKQIKDYYIKGECDDLVTRPKRFEKIFHRLRERATMKLIERYGGHSTILDVGCGTGLVTRRIKGDLVVGLDINRWNLMRAREHAPKVDPIIGDAENMPIKSDVVDTIICTQTIEHLPNPQRAIREMARTLKSNGKIIGTVPSKSPIWKYRRFLSSHIPTEPFHHNYTLKETVQLLRDLKILKIFKAVFNLTIFFVVEKKANYHKTEGR